MRVYLLLMMVIGSYAGNVLVGKAMNDLPPLTVTYGRLLVALVFLSPLGWKQFWHARSVFWTYKRPFVMLMLTGVTAFNTCIYAALQFTTATNASILETAVPVVTLVLSAWYLRETITWAQGLGSGLAFVGALTVVTNGQFTQLPSMPWNIGDGIMLGAIGSWAIYSVVLRLYGHYFPTWGLLWMMTACSLIVLLPWLLVEWWWQTVPDVSSLPMVSGFLYLGIFPSFLALLGYNYAVYHIGVSKTVISLNVVPLATMLGSWYWFDEPITLALMVGSALVFAGVYLVTRTKTTSNVEEKEAS